MVQSTLSSYWNVMICVATLSLILCGCERHGVGRSDRAKSLQVQPQRLISENPWSWEEKPLYRQWIEQVLLAEPTQVEGVSLPFRLAGICREDSRGPIGFVQCQGVSEHEMCMLIAAGPAAIRELIVHVRDTRETPWIFSYPLSSGISLKKMRVGELACYAIEAILRENPYFTRTGCLQYEMRGDVTANEVEIQALRQAAAEYEHWYTRCYDEETCTIHCSDDDYPLIPWDYDPTAWPGLLQIRESGLD